MTTARFNDEAITHTAISDIDCLIVNGKFYPKSHAEYDGQIWTLKYKLVTIDGCTIPSYKSWDDFEDYPRYGYIDESNLLPMSEVDGHRYYGRIPFPPPVVVLNDGFTLSFHLDTRSYFVGIDTQIQKNGTVHRPNFTPDTIAILLGDRTGLQLALDGAWAIRYPDLYFACDPMGEYQFNNKFFDRMRVTSVRNGVMETEEGVQINFEITGDRVIFEKQRAREIQSTWLPLPMFKDFLIMPDTKETYTLTYIDGSEVDCPREELFHHIYSGSDMPANLGFSAVKYTLTSEGYSGNDGSLLSVTEVKMHDELVTVMSLPLRCRSKETYFETVTGLRFYIGTPGQLFRYMAMPKFGHSSIHVHDLDEFMDVNFFIDRRPVWLDTLIRLKTDDVEFGLTHKQPFMIGGIYRMIYSNGKWVHINGVSDAIFKTKLPQTILFNGTQVLSRFDILNPIGCVPVLGMSREYDVNVDNETYLLKLSYPKYRDARFEMFKLSSEQLLNTSTWRNGMWATKFWEGSVDSLYHYLHGNGVSGIIPPRLSINIGQMSIEGDFPTNIPAYCEAIVSYFKRFNGVVSPETDENGSSLEHVVIPVSIFDVTPSQAPGIEWLIINRELYCVFNIETQYQSNPPIMVRVGDIFSPDIDEKFWRQGELGYNWRFFKRGGEFKSLQPSAPTSISSFIQAEGMVLKRFTLPSNKNLMKTLRSAEKVDEFLFFKSENGTPRVLLMAEQGHHV